MREWFAGGKQRLTSRVSEWLELKALTFRRKIMFYAIAVGGMALILASAAIMTYDFISTKKALIQRLQTQSEIISSYSTAPLVFKKRDPASNLLSALRLDQHILGAWIFDSNQKIFSSYARKSIGSSVVIPAPRPSGHYFIDGDLLIIEQIEFNNKPIGMIYLLADLSSLYARLSRLAAIFLGAMAFSLMLAMLLSHRMQRLITKPITELVRVARAISRDKNYSVRAKKLSNDEFGIFTEAFNQMLDAVQQREVTIRKSEERLQLALWGSDESLWDWNIRTGELYFDDRTYLYLGYRKGELQYNAPSLFRLVYREDMPKMRNALVQHFKQEKPYFEAEYRVNRKDGQCAWLLGRGKVVERDAEGRAVRMVGTQQDISLEKAANEELRLFAKVFESTAEGVMVLNPDFSVVTVNPAFLSITGYNSVDDVKDLGSFLETEQHNPNFYARLLSYLQRRGQWQGEIWGRRANKDEFPLRMNINEVRDAASIIHYVAVFSDITQSKQAEDELRYLANYDPLTGLPNRTLFLQHMSQALSDAKFHEKQLALLFCDLDHFKHINDSLGHAVGDLLLQEASERFSSCIRKNDVVARLGGDEFTLMLLDIESEQSVIKVANNLLEAFAKSFVLDGHELAVGTSIGICVFPADGTDPQSLLKKADTAMYHAKQQGRNTYQFFREEMNERAVERRRMESHLRKAIERKELELYYQPKIDIDTNNVVGVEALIRWHHPEKGLVGPAYFIPLAEETGLIIPIGLWVLREACRQGKEWTKQGLGDLSVAVNLSSYQFRTGDLAEVVARVLWETGFDPALLELELTESLLMENAEKSVLMLRVLKSMGVKIAIDDFGTGYSSLSYLKRFPLDSLKIDKSFVRDVTSDPEDAAIVTAIVAMAKRLQLNVIAEGVETEEQFEFLKRERCDEMQGFLFSGAVPVKDFISMLRDHKQSLEVLDRQLEEKATFRTGSDRSDNPNKKLS